jgi:hypothetical protein
VGSASGILHLLHASRVVDRDLNRRKCGVGQDCGIRDKGSDGAHTFVLDHIVQYTTSP